MPLDLDTGSKLEAAWLDSLNASLSYFKALLASSASSSWKPVQVLPLTASTTARDSGRSEAKACSLGSISAGDVAVHRRTGKTGEVFRAVVEVDCGPDVNVETFRGCLVTPETRPKWDRMVEEAATIDLLDAHTRVSRVNYRLGWPSSPRDAVTIGRTLIDSNTLIDISTSLPRSRNEPPYLRPAPPHVRAHVALLGWCIQISTGKAKITCMWSWDPKGAWAVGGGVPQHLPSVMVGLVDYTREGSGKVPLLKHFGGDVSIGSALYDPSRAALSVSYAVVGSGPDASRLVELAFSSAQGWEITMQASAGWDSFVGSSKGGLVLRLTHPPVDDLARYKVTAESTATSGVRINGVPVSIEPTEAPAPKRPLLEDVGSGISLRTFSTFESKPAKRNHATEKSIAALVRRNYIYFTSLLQEPEPKWRPVLDSRGVAIHQLNSIDKTLVLFRAEAVFVGVGIWDIYSILANPATRSVWDRSHDESELMQDINELTDLWHFRTKAAWPVAPRDSVMLKTTYKSPSSVHMFGFSVDDAELFRIPAVIDPTVIRTQIDLQGWSVESLSPNTTQVTLLEQSDPRGWSNKSSIPQVMMTTLAGIGEFAIKHGAPPVVTRLGGARVILTRYDVDSSTYRLDYEADEARRTDSSSTSTAFPLPVAVRSAANGETTSLKSLAIRKPISNIECEIRCDPDKWSNSIALLVDPPHVTISALKRHRLSPAGGGLWLTIEHDPALDEKVCITVRKGPSSPRTLVTVNGHKIKVDVQELSEADVQLLKKQKRAKPTRVPLDQPPALGTLRKRQSTMDIGAISDPYKTVTPAYTRFTLPLTRLYNVASETTRAAIVPMAIPAPPPAIGATPIDAATRALSQLTRMHADRESESTDPFGWQAVSERDGLKTEKRIVSHVSETFPVYRAGRIIEGFTAEEVSAAVSALKRDDQFEKPIRLQSYGHGIVVSQVTANTTFPFKGRSILLSTIVARAPDGPPPSPSTSSHAPLSTIFHASSSSFDPATIDFDVGKYNPLALPPGNFILEGWIIETIDPYSHEQYAIPSTRCMYVGAIDFSGNMPLSVNNMLNASLPRSILTVEQSLRFFGAPSRARLPASGVLLPEPTAQGPWAVEQEKGPMGVDERNDVDYHMLVTLQPTQRDMLAPPLKHNDSRSSMQSGKTIVDLGEDIRRGKRDSTVMEVEIGTVTAKYGGEVMIRAVQLPMAQNLSADQLLPLTLPSQDIDLPFKCSIIALAPTVLRAALDPTTTAPRHLLRITLPTSGYDAVDDPLIKTGPLPRPRWLLDLINDGAVVELRFKARLDGPTKYLYNGNELAVEEEKRSKGLPMRARLPQLVPKDTPNATSLEKPLAVSRDHMTAAPPIIHSVTRGSVSSAVTAPPVETAPVEAPPPPIDTKHAYSFWKYPRLRPFSAPASAEASPAKPIPVLPLVPEAEDVETSPSIPLSVVIVLCLACLLLGSLLRSLLVDADFVIRLPKDVAVPSGFRELRRVMEWRIAPGRDLVIAIARG